MTIRQSLSGALLLLGWLSGHAQAAGPYAPVQGNGGLPVSQTGSSFVIDGNFAVLDYDGDGDGDVAMTGDGFPAFHLFENNGDGTFEDVTQVAGLSGVIMSAVSVTAADVDGNGFPDLLVGSMEDCTLFMNQGDGTFSNETSYRLPGGGGFTAIMNPGDFDKDGDLDIYVVRYVDVVKWPFHRCGLDVLWVNDGRGFFSEAPQDWGLTGKGCGLSSVWTDIDQDGDLDIMVANDFGFFVERSYVYRNDGPTPGGGWSFVEVGEEFGLHRPLYGMGIGVFDANRDGFLDYYLTSIGRDLMLRSNGSGGVYDATEGAGLGGTWSNTGYRTKWAPITLDMDGDGWDDLYVRTGHVPAYWFIGNPQEQTDLPYLFNGSGTGTLSKWIAPDAAEMGRGGVAADLDGDGIRDLLLGATDGGIVRVLKGTNPESGLWLHLNSTVSAPGAPGARSLLSCDGYQKVDELTPGGWFGSSPPLGELFVGIPQDCGEDWSLTLQWPSGALTTVSATTETSVELTEPVWWEWLGTDSEGNWTLAVQPEALGKVVLNAGELALVLPDGTVGGFVEGEGPGWFEVSVAAELEGQHVGLMINGQLHVNPQVPHMSGLPDRVYPHRIVSGKEMTFFLHHEEQDPISLNYQVTAGTIIFAEEFAPGIVQVDVATQPWADSITLSGGTLPEGESLTLDAFPPLSFENTTVLMDNLFLPAGPLELVKPLRVTVDAMDDNRVRELPAGVEFEVRVDGEFYDFFSPGAPGSPATIQLLPTLYEPGSVIEVFVNGVPLGGPAVIMEIEGLSDLIPHISPTQSRLAPSFGNCRADGMDRVAVVFQPRTEQGNSVPLTLLSGAMVLTGENVSIASTLGSVGKFMEGEVRCGDVLGVTELDVAWEGGSLGMSAELELREPEPLPPVTKTESTLVFFGLGNGIWSFNFRPRTALGNLVGSGLEPTLSFNDGEACIPLEYCGVGKYCVLTPIPPGDHTVAIVLDGEVFMPPEELSESNDVNTEWKAADLEACSLTGGEGPGDEDVIEGGDAEEGDTGDSDGEEPDGGQLDAGEPDTSDSGSSDGQEEDGEGQEGGQDSEETETTDDVGAGDGWEEEGDGLAEVDVNNEDDSESADVQSSGDEESFSDGKRGPEGLEVNQEQEEEGAQDTVSEVGSGSETELSSQRDEGCQNSRGGNPSPGVWLGLLGVFLSRGLKRSSHLLHLKP